ncbi:MAG: CRISPR-associated endonuclease Cas2 [Alphaproteobacteria bacterium]|nr:CRISPR-associated endonuclease Cas2 [Alphaproteobacteria bacterium]
MWMMVMFDLPVIEPEERKIATKFRDFLIDNGFEMCQFSVYLRFCGTREKANPLIKNIKEHIPPQGNISILFFTDKQFAEILTFENRKTVNLAEQPEQLTLF